MSDKIREAFNRIHAKIIDGNIASAFSIFKEGYEAGAALAQQPAAAVPEDLHARCAEIIAWQKTGVLKGDALRGYARAQWYADEHNSLQMAEADTARQAYALLVASSPAYQQAAPVAVPAEASADDAPQMSADTEPEIAWRDGWNSCRDAMLTAAPAAQEPVAWQDPENEDRICSARSMREARQAGGATLTALKPLSRPLYAAPPAAEQPDHSGDSADMVWCACGDGYPADTYDAGFIHGAGMCQNCDAAIPARDIQPDTVKVPRELLERAAKSTANGWVDYPTSKKLRALLGKESEA